MNMDDHENLASDETLEELEPVEEIEELETVSEEEGESPLLVSDFLRDLARSYEKRGLARVLDQQDMTRETMTRALLDLLRDREALRAAVSAYPVKDGTDAVLALIEQAQQGR